MFGRKQEDENRLDEKRDYWPKHLVYIPLEVSALEGGENPDTANWSMNWTNNSATELRFLSSDEWGDVEG